MATFTESFDNGVGALDHAWGNVDTSVPGQVTLRDFSGVMEWPSGASAGHGYGTYSFVASMTGDHAGSAALLWPADDHWPGPEYDAAETMNGQVYGTAHWNDNGNDAYQAVIYKGFDPSQVHTYTLDWQPGSITYSVDGTVVGTVDHGVGADAAHGGINEAIGANNISHDTSITLYEVSYTPHTDNVWA